MLGKLLKYENKVLSKILLPLGIGVLLVSLFGSLMMKLNLSVSHWLQNNTTLVTMIQAVTGTFFAFALIAIVSASFVCFFILMQRYYKNLFTDEGYLTFTLPVKVRDILFSKVLAGVLWSVFVMLCTLIGVFLISLFGTTRSLINTAALEWIRDAWQALIQLRVTDMSLPLLVLQVVLLMLCSVFEQFLLIYLAITLGNQVAKKHKVLGAVLMYFVVYMICQGINMVLMIAIGTVFGGIDALVTITPTNALFHWFLLFATLLVVVYSVVFFCINHHIVKNKLNLE